MGFITDLVNALKNSKFAKSVMVLSAGTLVSNSLILLSTPILTYLYTPAEFGILSIYLSLLYSLKVVVSLLYEEAIPLPKSEEEGFHLLGLSLIIAFIFSVLVWVSGSMLPVGSWFNAPVLDHYSWMLAISLLGIGFYEAFNLWSVRKESFKTISSAKVSMNSGQTASQVLLGLFNFNFIGLLVGDMAGRLTGFAAFLKLLIKNKELPSFSVLTISGLIRVMRRYKKFPLISSWSNIIESVCDQIPTFFLAAFFGPEAAGLYLLAQKILIIPEGLISYPVSQVYVSQAVQYLRDEKKKLLQLFKKTIQKMAFISFTVVGLIVLITPFLIDLIFGEEWKGAGGYLQAAALYSVSRMVVMPVSKIFYVVEAQIHQIVGKVISLLLMISAIWVCAVYIEDPVLSIFCISIFAAIGYIIYGLFAWFAMNKKLRVREEDGSHGN
ncbi:lipopolysaccharide biosynthesis protein [Bacillus sp. SCS-153A]|uniref:lipopolysaccharide biosynthesis protein n=1 Tax=Rossellomorea sedimentorum TaxID=3115294 RepID=UPI0039061EED